LCIRNSAHDGAVKLTIADCQRSLKVDMQRAQSNGRGARLEILLAIATVLALLIAPLCAPLCSGKLCAPATDREQCHESSAANQAPQNWARQSICRGFEISAVLPKADVQLAASSSLGDALLPLPAPAKAPFASAAGEVLRQPELSPPFRSSESFLETIVLQL
jgi:hypothetical protein